MTFFLKSDDAQRLLSEDDPINYSEDEYEVLKMNLFGVCKDGQHWGDAPKGFNESRHFLMCRHCGKLASLDRHDPKEVGYHDKNKVEMQVVNQRDYPNE